MAKKDKTKGQTKAGMSGKPAAEMKARKIKLNLEKILKICRE